MRGLVYTNETLVRTMLVSAINLKIKYLRRFAPRPKLRKHAQLNSTAQIYRTGFSAYFKGHCGMDCAIISEKIF
jgi:hypothetical protein